MYKKKRLLHIKRAEKAFGIKNTEEETADSFSYDKEYLYDALVQSTDDYIYVCNMKTGIFRYTKAMVEEFDLPGEVISDAASIWGAKVHPHDKQAFLDSNKEIAEGRTDCHSVEYRAMNRKGEWVWMRCRGHLERDESGEPLLFAGMITNLGKRKRVDHMTGLPNKYECEQEVSSLIHMRPNHAVGIMILGIDGFKHINDLYSREFGDEVIRIVAQKIQSLLPQAAAIYRFDGDLFCVVFQDATKDKMGKLFEKIRRTFSHQQEFNNKKYYSSLSAGAVLYPQDGMDYSNLSKYAEYSLDYAKHSGKKRIVFFSGEIMKHKTRLLDLTERLRDSVEHNFRGFNLNYQLQVEADSGIIAGAEALARWGYQGEENVGPGEFIPILEACGLIQLVGRWIFKTAAGACARWVKLCPWLTISINLSYLQLADPGLIYFMKRIMEEINLDPSHIIVEMTESTIVSDISALNNVFEEMRSIGIKIAMDDFGTGYSSLGVLKSAPADIVKIDRIFVKDILTSSFDMTFIRFVVQLCHDVGIEVCLEGVETEEEYEIVRSMGLDYIQGYLFGKPMTGDDFESEYLS